MVEPAAVGPEDGPGQILAGVGREPAPGQIGAGTTVTVSASGETPSQPARRELEERVPDFRHP